MNKHKNNNTVAASSDCDWAILLRVLEEKADRKGNLSEDLNNQGIYSS